MLRCAATEKPETPETLPLLFVLRVLPLGSPTESRLNLKEARPDLVKMLVASDKHFFVKVASVTAIASLATPSQINDSL